MLHIKRFKSPNEQRSLAINLYEVQAYTIGPPIKWEAVPACFVMFYLKGGGKVEIDFLKDKVQRIMVDFEKDWYSVNKEERDDNHS